MALRLLPLLIVSAAASEQCTGHEGALKAMAALDRRADAFQDKPNHCEEKIDPRWLAAVRSFIRTRQVAVFGVERSPGLQKIHDRLGNIGACWDFWDMWQAEVINYLTCMYPEQNQANTFVFLNGALVGNGLAFAGDDVTDEQLKDALLGAHAEFECGSPEKCQHLAPAEEIERAEALRRSKPVILFGWEGCPCTRMGQARLHEAGACFHIELWRTPNAPLLRYYQCIYGMDDHSFVWIGNKHIGTGFALSQSRMPQAALDKQLKDAGALTECVTPHRYHQQVVEAKQQCPEGFSGAFPDCEKDKTPAPPSTVTGSAKVGPNRVVVGVDLALASRPEPSNMENKDNEDKKHGPGWIMLSGLALCFTGLVAYGVCRYRRAKALKDPIKGIAVPDVEGKEKMVEVVEKPVDEVGPSTPGASNEDKSMSPAGSQGSAGESKTPYESGLPTEPISRLPTTASIMAD